MFPQSGQEMPQAASTNTSCMKICTDKIAALACFSGPPSTAQQPTVKKQPKNMCTPPSTLTLDTASIRLVSSTTTDTTTTVSPSGDTESLFSDTSTDVFSPYDSQQINEAIHVFLSPRSPRYPRPRSPSSLSSRTSRGSIGSADTFVEPTVLSLHNRGVTVVGWNDNLEKRSVIRISPRVGRSVGRFPTAKDVSGSQQAADRILLFGRFVCEQAKGLPGLVPFLSTPKLVRNHFLVEQYEEILFSGGGDDLAPPRRLDLHTYIVDNMDGANARKGFSYLHDVLQGIIAMHGHGWAHLDLSLENIVLSNDRAYIIDFESVLPFVRADNACLRRKDLRVPLKAPFVPPEHFEAEGDDLLSLPSYDVWAFGVMFFTVLFREYVFASREIIHARHGTKQLIPDREQVDYFMANGFRKFCRKYHSEKYMLLFHTSATRVNANGKRKKINPHTASYLALCGDLLSKIFRRPCQIPVGLGKVAHAHCHGRRSSEPIYFCDCTRFTAQDVYNHPFWEVHHIRPSA